MIPHTSTSLPPHEINPLIYCNQTLLYSLFHRCCAETLLELSSFPKYLRATPGIIQVLHIWNQEPGYHMHLHCIISGGGLTRKHTLRISKKEFFIPVHVLRDKFKEKFLACLKQLYRKSSLRYPYSCKELLNSYDWKEFRDSLYGKDWYPFIKETFNGFGNAIEYLGRYTHKIALFNSHILSVDDTQITFSARELEPSGPPRTVTLTNTEFIRRYLTHVLPSGFQKIRYYGFLNNQDKTKNLKLIFTSQRLQRYKARYTNLTMTELLNIVWNVDIFVCPVCGCHRIAQSQKDV